MLLRYLTLLVGILFADKLFAQGFAMPDKKVKPKPVVVPKPVNNASKGRPVPKVVWGIDTFINPPSVVTASSHSEVEQAIMRLDYLDGEQDSAIHNFRDDNYDKIITEHFIVQTRKAQAYIENETFDYNPTLNLNIKKKYLKLIVRELDYVSRAAYRPDVEVATYKDLIVRIQEMAYANKEKRLDTYVEANADESTFRLIEIFSQDSITKYKLYNQLSLTKPQLIEHFPLMQLAKLDGFCNIMQKLASTKPNKILVYSTSTGEERQVIRRCNDAYLQQIIKLGDECKVPIKAIAFLDDYIKQNKTAAQIDSMCANEDAYYKALVLTHLNNKGISGHVVTRDLAALAKRYVQEVNELHEASDAKRFQCTDNMLPQDLYYLCVLGNQEIYTSSYLGIYKRLMQKLGKRTGTDLMQIMGYDKFRTFIRMCANYNTLSNFLGTMPENEGQLLMSKFAKGLGQNAQADIEGAVDVADAIGSISDAKLTTFLKKQINDEYNEANATKNKSARNIYLILSAIFDVSDSNSSFTKQFNLPPIASMPNSMVQTDSTVYEQMFFYGDEDGQVGYKSFLGSFDKNKWQIDATAQYWTIVRSINTKVPVIIYANKALQEPEDETAQARLAEYLQSQNINPHIIVHRGHSYHLENTIKAMTPSHRIIILGSCGGYQNLKEILARSPEAHIISTKQVGAFAVNTPIINSVNSTLYNGEDIVWNKMWTKLADGFKGNARNKELFDDYIPPHKNLGALFLKAYYNLESQ
jgi:hypothetical protein